MNRFPCPQRWDRLREIPRELGRLLETYEPLHGWRSGRPFPAVDLHDEGDHFVVIAELPGMTSEGIDLSILGESLTLRGERKPPEGIAEESYRHRGRPRGPWSRTLILPGPVVREGVVADLADGVLTVTLPKASEAEPRTIPVSSAD